MGADYVKRLVYDCGTPWGAAMAKSMAAYEEREKLAWILDMLNALSGFAAGDGTPMLSSFVELAAAQARDEYTILDRRTSSTATCERPSF